MNRTLPAEIAESLPNDWMPGSDGFRGSVFSLAPSVAIKGAYSAGAKVEVGDGVSTGELVPRPGHFWAAAVLGRPTVD
jgi:hypothetical protein